jgi:diaminopimelate decarboxylase
MAIDAGIGCFVIDNFIEMHLVDQIAAEKGVKVKALFRVTPGVEAHTHEYISTGQQDSKFGFDITNGSAARAFAEAKELANIEILGVHSHIGSQIFEVEGFQMAVQRVADFSQTIREQLGITFTVVNLGGGFGIRYIDGHTPLPISQYVKAITDSVKTYFAANEYPVPQIWVEPGRSIVGEAGTTLYTVGSVKEIPGIRKYVAVDGGMTDNPRPALYQSKYEAILANRATEESTEVVSIAGKCCESGDMLIWDLSLPQVTIGDVLAVSCTGAYNYAMASNYNRIRRPAVVFAGNGEADVVVKRESFHDIVANDLIPVRMS